MLTYTSFNKVKDIEEDGKKVSFRYGPDDARKRVEWYQGRTLLKTRFYTANYEKEVDANNQEKEIHYISGGSGLAAMYVIENGTGSLYYPYRDHLGSILTVTDANANIVAEQRFDAWGRKRQFNKEKKKKQNEKKIRPLHQS